MVVKKKNSVRPNSQGRVFIQAARELGCDEDEVAFDAKLRRLAKAKPQPEKDEASRMRKKAGYEKDH